MVGELHLGNHIWGIIIWKKIALHTIYSIHVTILRPLFVQFLVRTSSRTSSGYSTNMNILNFSDSVVFYFLFKIVKGDVGGKENRTSFNIRDLKIYDAAARRRGFITKNLFIEDNSHE